MRCGLRRGARHLDPTTARILQPATIKGFLSHITVIQDHYRLEAASVTPIFARRLQSPEEQEDDIPKRMCLPDDSSASSHLAKELQITNKKVNRKRVHVSMVL